MRGGKLDKLITLLRPVAVDDDMGGRGIDEWQEVAKVWAEFIRPRLLVTGVDGGIASVQVQEIKIRRRTDVVPGWRVKYGDEIREIEHVDSSVTRSETSLTTRITDYGAP